MKSILILAAGPLQLPAILTAKRIGLRVIVADADSKAVGLKYADSAVVMDITNPIECLKVAQSENIDGALVLCTEAPLNSLALINETMNLSGVNSKQIQLSTNKARMREALDKHNVPSPRSYRCKTFDDALNATKVIGDNCIVKPCIGMGSKGIFHTCTANELEEAFRRAQCVSTNEEVLVEEFVDGPEFSVETLTWDNHTEVIAITDKITTGSPYWVEMGHSQPSLFPGDIQSQLKKVTIAGINALGLDQCAGHTEIKLSSVGPKIIEIGPRLGGDFITTELTPRSTGIDIVKGAIEIAIGQKPDIASNGTKKSVAVRYFAAKPGYFVEAEHIEELLTKPNIVSLEVAYKIGDYIPEVKSSSDRTGWVIAEAALLDNAVAACQDALNTLVIRTSPNKPNLSNIL